MTLSYAASISFAVVALAAAPAARAADPLGTFGTAPDRSASYTSPGQARPEPVAELPPASTAPPALQLVVQMSADRGETWIVKADLSDGTSPTLHLNGGFGMSAGVAFLHLLDGALNTQATVGFEAWSIDASNGSVRWLAYPIEVMEFVNLGPVRFGAGLSYLVAPSVKGKEFFAAAQYEFDNSAGLLVEVDWTAVNQAKPRWPRLWLGLRYESQTLVEKGGGEWIGNAWGVVAGAAL